jgi:hypothetical protein
LVSAGVACHANAEQGSIEPSAAAQAAKWIGFRKAPEGYHGFRIPVKKQQIRKNAASILHFDNLRYILRYIEMETKLCLNKKNVNKDGTAGTAVSISTTGRNGTAEGMGLVAQWAMKRVSVAAAASGTSTTGNCGS